MGTSISINTHLGEALEGLCEILMILPKEIKSLKAHVYKLETIIHVITRKIKGTNLKHKVNTAGQKDKLESVGKQCDLGDKYWSDQDGNLFWVAKSNIQQGCCQ
ncbi:hypothetical protein Tco_1415289 [Tanacetum coccineum]